MTDLCPSCHVPELHLHHEDCPVRLKAEIEYLKTEVGKFQDLYDRELHDGQKMAEALLEISDMRCLSEARTRAREVLETNG